MTYNLTDKDGKTYGSPCNPTPLQWGPGVAQEAEPGNDRTIRIIEKPVLTTAQRVRTAILLAYDGCGSRAWRQWADRWLSGEDRSEAAAVEAALAAARVSAAEAEAAEARVSAADAAAAATAAAKLATCTNEKNCYSLFAPYEHPHGWLVAAKLGGGGKEGYLG